MFDAVSNLVDIVFYACWGCAIFFAYTPVSVYFVVYTTSCAGCTVKAFYVYSVHCIFFLNRGNR